MIDRERLISEKQNNKASAEGARLPKEATGLSMGMGFPWESHGKCPMGWDGMGLHALHFPWDLWDSSHVIAF